MPQLSLYIDNNTLKKIESAAKMEHLSISKFVVRTMNESLESNWPENYENLFGSINDTTFCKPENLSFNSDLPRELL